MQTALARVVVASRRRTVNNLEAYARTTLLRTFLDDNRRLWRRREWSSPEPQDAAVPAQDPTVALAVLAALRSLPPRQRAVVVLWYWEDHSMEETAEALDINTGTVKSQCAKALAAPRQTLAGPPDRAARVQVVRQVWRSTWTRSGRSGRGKPAPTGSQHRQEQGPRDPPREKSWRRSCELALRGSGRADGCQASVMGRARIANRMTRPSRHIAANSQRCRPALPAARLTAASGGRPVVAETSTVGRPVWRRESQRRIRPAQRAARAAARPARGRRAIR